MGGFSRILKHFVPKQGGVPDSDESAAATPTAFDHVYIGGFITVIRSSDLSEFAHSLCPDFNHLLYKSVTIDGNLKHSSDQTAKKLFSTLDSILEVSTGYPIPESCK